MNRLVSIGLSIAIAPAIVIGFGRYLGSEDAVFVASRFLFAFALPLAAVLIIVGILVRPVRVAVAACEEPRRTFIVNLRRLMGAVVIGLRKLRPASPLLSYKRTWALVSVLLSAAVAYRYRQLAEPWLWFCLISIPMVTITTNFVAEAHRGHGRAIVGGVLLFGGVLTWEFAIDLTRGAQSAVMGAVVIILPFAFGGLALLGMGTFLLRSSSSRHTWIHTLLCVLPTLIYLGYQLEGAKREHLAKLKDGIHAEHVIH